MSENTSSKTEAKGPSEDASYGQDWNGRLVQDAARSGGSDPVFVTQNVKENENMETEKRMRERNSESMTEYPRKIDVEGELNVDPYVLDQSCIHSVLTPKAKGICRDVNNDAIRPILGTAATQCDICSGTLHEDDAIRTVKSGVVGVHRLTFQDGEYFNVETVVEKSGDSKTETVVRHNDVAHCYTLRPKGAEKIESREIESVHGTPERVIAEHGRFIDITRIRAHEAGYLDAIRVDANGERFQAELDIHGGAKNYELYNGIDTTYGDYRDHITYTADLMDVAVVNEWTPEDPNWVEYPDEIVRVVSELATASVVLCEMSKEISMKDYQVSSDWVERTRKSRIRRAAKEIRLRIEGRHPTDEKVEEADAVVQDFIDRTFEGAAQDRRWWVKPSKIEDLFKVVPAGSDMSDYLFSTYSHRPGRISRALHFITKDESSKTIQFVVPRAMQNISVFNQVIPSFWGWKKKELDADRYFFVDEDVHKFGIARLRTLESKMILGHWHGTIVDFLVKLEHTVSLRIGRKFDIREYLRPVKVEEILVPAGTYTVLTPEDFPLTITSFPPSSGRRSIRLIGNPHIAYAYKHARRVALRDATLPTSDPRYKTLRGIISHDIISLLLNAEPGDGTYRFVGVSHTVIGIMKGVYDELGMDEHLFDLVVPHVIEVFDQSKGRGTMTFFPNKDRNREPNLGIFLRNVNACGTIRCRVLDDDINPGEELHVFNKAVRAIGVDVLAPITGHTLRYAEGLPLGRNIRNVSGSDMITLSRATTLGYDYLATGWLATLTINIRQFLVDKKDWILSLKTGKHNRIDVLQHLAGSWQNMCKSIELDAVVRQRGSATQQLDYVRFWGTRVHTPRDVPDHDANGVLSEKLFGRTDVSEGVNT